LVKILLIDSLFATFNGQVPKALILSNNSLNHQGK
jgi:hypothetical protein